MSDLNCPCKPVILHEVFIQDRLASEEPTTSYQHFQYTVSFEVTVVNTTAKKIFRIYNDSKETQAYVLQRDPNTNPIYHTFNCKLSRKTIPPDDFLEVLVTYKPTVPNEKSVDNFQIVDEMKNLHDIRIQGECIGPNVVFSTKQLYFYNTVGNYRLMHTFEMRSKSAVPAQYQFDVNEDPEEQEVFKVEEIRGTLEPFRHKFITVKFEPKKQGLFQQQLFCLILHHKPVVLNLVGMNFKERFDGIPDASLKPYQHEITRGFSAYVQDSVKLTTQTPHLSLSLINYDFGKCSEENSATLPASLTNHLPTQVRAKWINYNDTTFSITPLEVNIPPMDSALFECHFTPPSADQLYSKNVSACVYYSEEKVQTANEEVFINLPLNVQLTFLGNSFPEHKEWLPRVEIVPSVVILPPALPMSATFSTFMLKARGHLPTAFKFIPPKKTSFLLKPMLGIIHDYQIIVVQFYPDCHNKKAFVECWGLELNGQPQKCVVVYLKGYCEYPDIVVGNNNVVVFKPVHPGCEDMTKVTVKNTTVHYLKYNFLVPENCHIRIDHPRGQLASNEEVTLVWFVTASHKMPEVVFIECEMRTMQKVKMITGAPMHISVTVYSSSAYTKLCANPHDHDFGELLWGCMESTTFLLYNFGDSPIHFGLLREGPAENDVTLVPVQGTVRPKEKMKIMVQVKPSKVGKQRVVIMYQVRLNELSSRIVDEEQHRVFKVTFLCNYPTFQIEDILGNNFGFLFSKVVLWDMFKIERFNKILWNIEHDQEQTIEVTLPEFQKNERSAFFLNFIIKNVSHFSTFLKMKRVRLCDCPLIRKSVTFTTTRKVYKCIHRDMFRLSLGNELFDAGQSQTLRLDVKYLQDNWTQMQYTLTLCNNRRINYVARMRVLPEIVTIASKYSHTYELKLTTVYIGERDPPAQAFSLYNNSNFSIGYEVDVTRLNNLNFDFDFEVLTCLNPKGIILPYSTKEIMFIFTPIEARKYNVIVPIKMGENEVNLQIYGCGSLTKKIERVDDKLTMPFYSKGQNTDRMVELSTEHIVVAPLSSWSAIETMFFIRNQTHDRTIGYAWDDLMIDDVIHLEVIPRKGVLQPRNNHYLVLRASSFSRPCQLRLQLKCRLLDHTQHIIHKRTEAAYLLRQKELEQQFIITEKGTSYPKNTIVIEPPSGVFYVTLSASLYVVGMSDVHLYFNNEEMLEESPPNSMPINMTDVLNEYGRWVLQRNVNLVANSKPIENKPGASTMNDTMLKVVLECIIADAVFKESFCKVAEITNSSPEASYLQFKIEGVGKRGVTLGTLEKQMGMIERVLNKSQAPMFANIFKDLVAQSMNSLFQLGQTDNQLRKPFIHPSMKKKLACFECNCNNPQ